MPLLALKIFCLSAPFSIPVFTAPVWSNASQQAHFMRRCITLAHEATAKGGAPFGSLIADPVHGSVLVEGRNHAGKNPIWHGEMDAINALAQYLHHMIARHAGHAHDALCRLIKPRRVRDIAPSLELYTTAEPCAMCMGAATWARFGRVVYGSSVPFLAAHGTPQAHDTPCCSTSFHAAPYRAMTNHIHALPCYAMPCHAMPCYAMLCHAMPCYAMRCHAIHGMLQIGLRAEAVAHAAGAMHAPSVIGGCLSNETDPLYETHTPSSAPHTCNDHRRHEPGANSPPPSVSTLKQALASRNYSGELLLRGTAPFEARLASLNRAGILVMAY